MGLSAEDEARIDELTDALKAAWKRTPHCRLGQLIVNAATPTHPCPEIFYINDREMFKRLEEW